MHHGYYIDPKDRNHKQRQVDMIDRAIAWAYLNDANDISHMESKISIKNMVVSSSSFCFIKFRKLLKFP